MKVLKDVVYNELIWYKDKYIELENKYIELENKYNEWISKTKK